MKRTHTTQQKSVFVALTSLASVASLFVTACGSKSEAEPESDPTAPEAAAPAVNASLAKLDSSGDVMNFALNALGSSMKGSESAALALEGDEPVLHATFPQCTEHGEAFSQEENRRMEASDASFSETTLFCQMNVKESSETFVGSLTMAKKVLCSVEESLGKVPEYTAAGTTYSNVKLKLTTGCGWSAREISEMSGQLPPAKLVTKELTSGDWKRSVTIELPGAVDFQLFYTVAGDILAIKKVEGWTQSERCAESGSSCNSTGLIADGASGSRGDVIAIDLKSGILRAETTDNYWGRRARGLVKGTLDAASGKFSSVSGIELLYSTVYVNQGDQGVSVSGKVASAKGTSAAGILFKGGEVTCGSMSGCDVDAFATSGSFAGPAAVCSKSGGCSGNAGFNFAFSNAKVLDFVRLGADFDTKGGSRAKNEKWLATAGIPTFESVDFGATID